MLEARSPPWDPRPGACTPLPKGWDDALLGQKRVQRIASWTWRRDTRTSTQSRWLVRRKGASWNINSAFWSEFASAYAAQVHSSCASVSAVYLPFFVFGRDIQSQVAPKFEVVGGFSCLDSRFQDELFSLQTYIVLHCRHSLLRSYFVLLDTPLRFADSESDMDQQFLFSYLS